jgi:hypothetical protein
MERRSSHQRRAAADIPTIIAGRPDRGVPGVRLVAILTARPNCSRPRAGPATIEPKIRRFHSQQVP